MNVMEGGERVVAVAKLRGIIAERGMSHKQVAQSMGISEKTFYNKMKKGVFGTDEAMALTDILQIENPSEIFLARK